MPEMNRRRVLKATGGLAGVGLLGSVKGKSVEDKVLVHANLTHEFNEEVPDNVVRVSGISSLFHYVVDEEIILNEDLAFDDIVTLFENNNKIIWADEYESGAAEVAREGPRPILTTDLTGALQPQEAVQTVNSYRAPKVEVTINSDDSATVSYRNEEHTVEPQADESIDLKERNVVLELYGENKAHPIKATPKIVVENYGRLPTKIKNS